MNDEILHELIDSNKKLIIAMGMHWENEQRKMNGQSIAYTDSDFNNLVGPY